MNCRSLVILFAFLAILIFGIAPPATAGWEAVDEYTEKFQGNDGLLQLKSLYPRTFKTFGGSYEGRNMDSASTTTIVYRFFGNHSCPEDDPRLIRKAQVSGSFCLAPEPNELIGCSFFTSSACGGATDPCYSSSETKEKK